MAIEAPRYPGAKPSRQKQDHCRKQSDDHRSRRQFFQDSLLRQVDLTHLVRMFLSRNSVVDVAMFLMRMFRRGRLMIVSMRVQPRALDKHQGDSQVGYPEDFRERG